MSSLDFLRVIAIIGIYLVGVSLFIWVAYDNWRD